MFKSYYVVWKLVKNPKIIGATVSFKSYYVVWKPEITANPNMSIQGLNRTM